MSSVLKCSNCTFSTGDIPDAMEHVGVSLGHVMSVELDQGSVLTVALDDGDTDDWDEDAL